VTSAIPCFLHLQRELDCYQAPPGFALLRTTAYIQFDSRDSPITCQVGDRAHVTQCRIKQPILELLLTITDIHETEIPHVFVLEAMRVDIVQHEMETPRL